MTRRFDEIELYPGAIGLEASAAVDGDDRFASQLSGTASSAPLVRRALTLGTDLSLFAAMAAALGTLVTGHQTTAATATAEWPAIAAIGGFLLLLSSFYFVGCWVLWGRTVGGTIFDIRVVSDGGGEVDIRSAAKRWLFTCLSFLTLGIGFGLALLPSRKSLADRFSRSRSIRC